MSATIAVVNQKGGVAKTTTAVNIAAALGMSGLKVLIVDLDPQGNATTGVGFKNGTGFEYTTFDVLTGKAAAEDAALGTDFDNLFIIPSNVELSNSETYFQHVKTDFPRFEFLRRALEPVKLLFDIIIIDCLPSLGTLALNGVAAADSMIIPMQCEPYSMDGLKEILSTTTKMRVINPSLNILGIVFTMIDERTRLSKDIKAQIRRRFQNYVFNVEIPRNVRITEAPSYGQPVVYYSPGSVGAENYRVLANEILERLKNRAAPMLAQ